MTKNGKKPSVEYVEIKVPVIIDENYTGLRPMSIDKLEVRMLTQAQRNALVAIRRGLEETHERCADHIPVHKFAHAGRWLLDEISRQINNRESQPKKRKVSGRSA